MRNLGLGLVMVGVVACSKSQPPGGAAPANTSSAAAALSAAMSAAAVGLGCEATSLDGWLQLLCRKKNGTGGHPVRAVVKGGEPAAPSAQEPGVEPADAKAENAEGQELTANEQG